MSELALPVAPLAPSPLRRVLHLINGEHYAGAERVQDLLAGRLPEFGFEVAFACVKPRKFVGLRMSQQAALFETPMRGGLDVRAVRAVTELIRCGGFHMIHAHTPRTALVGSIAAKLAGVPLVYHVHSPALRETTDALRNRLRGWVERWSLRGAVRLIAVSQSLRQHMIAQGFSSQQVVCVPNGVPSPVGLSPRRPPMATWRLGMVALFRPRKGLEVLLQAIARLRAEGTEVILHAVGEFETADYQASIHRLVARLGLEHHVRWRGFRRDVHEELRRVDLCVLPSLFGEGMPMVVLEAMAAGVPVIATRVEGVGDAIRDGIDGQLVEPGDVQGMIRALRQTVSGQVNWQRLRRSALARHATEFSDQAMARRVSQVYRDVLESV